MEQKYRKYTIIKYYKLHANNIFKTIDNNASINFKLNDEDYLKIRPAIIWDIVELNGNFKYLILPLTTKETKGLFNLKFRSKIKISNLNSKSFIMWDSIINIDENLIIGNYNKNGKTVKLSEANKKYILREKYFKDMTIFNNNLDFKKYTYLSSQLLINNLSKIAWNNSNQIKDENPKIIRECYICKEIINGGNKWNETNPKKSWTINFIDGNPFNYSNKNFCIVHFECLNINNK
ncbi:hypothetical protein [Spiroplasma taiwanense]|uniref:Uncharacterized protein n=1 Tax=Spiroplasma taiwanense CT-1 TaxID=1276220 RepID=S5LYS3_9MOLU|nr:hypothetical protein [Spiroplasma taiwanense]AGR41691.1 hypothetical protein STAIW_v1c11080 [Spiroplasma taiwanense CT-1]